MSDTATVPTLPPGPRLPRILQTLAFLFRIKNDVPARWRARYGDMYTVRLLRNTNLVVLVDASTIREVFTGPADVFHSPQVNPVAPILGEHSVFLANEDTHLRLRKMLMPAFNGAALRGYADLMDGIAGEILAGWPVGKPFAVHGSMNAYTLEVILRVVFGFRDGPRLEELRPLIGELTTVSPITLQGWDNPVLATLPPWRRRLRDLARIDVILRAEIAERRRWSGLAERVDVLSRLLAADPDTHEDVLRDNLLTLLVAGHETTATALTWVFHELVHNPDELARAKAAVTGDDSPYIQAMVKEGMRLHPVVPSIARQLVRDTVVGGFLLPAGTIVAPDIDLVHHDLGSYPDPERFDPRRFLDASVETARWLPFGGGLRRCIGAAFALQEAQVILERALREFDFAPGGPVERPVPRNLTAAPAQGGRILARRRP